MPISDAGELNKKLDEAHDLLQRGRYRESRPLFEQAFDGSNKAVASALGFIHSQQDTNEYDLEKAVRYYEIAAQQDDAYAQYALAGILAKKGRPEEALQWYHKASDLGDSACSYKLYLTYRLRGNTEKSERFLNRAIEQGNPAALQQLAIRYAIGRFGFKGIPWGIYMYFKNIPNLIRFARENVS